jgi:hypothetical protein
LAGLIEHQEPGVAVGPPKRLDPAVIRRLGRSRVRRTCLHPEVLGYDLDRALDHPNQVVLPAVEPITRQLAETEGHPTLPHQEGDHARADRGGVAGGALPISAGISPDGRRKPNGSACQRRTMAGDQDEAKHAIRAMSPLKSCDVEKPQPQR